MKKQDAIMWAIALFGAVGTAYYFYGVLTPNSDSLAIQISSYLDQAYKDCKTLNDAERSHLQDTLLSAQKALTIEKNYNKAVNLLNSVNSDLLTCSGKLQMPYGGLELASLLMIFIVTLVGIRTVLKHFWL